MFLARYFKVFFEKADKRILHGLFYNGLLIEQIKRRARSNSASNGVSKGSYQHCRVIYTRGIMRAIFLATICTNGKHVIRCEWLV